MKRSMMILFVLAMVISLMTGCRRAGTNETGESTEPTESQPTQTQPTTQPTEQTGEPTETDPMITGTANTTSARILAKIWNAYAADERFASYGGTVEHSVADAPGDLDMTNTEEITTKYLLPVDQLSYVDEGASLVHLMNSNIFTGAVFRLTDGADEESVAKALRGNLQKTQWVCGQPDRLLIAEIDDHLLMAFGAADVMDTFRQKLSTVYEDADVFYNEAVTA